MIGVDSIDPKTPPLVIEKVPPPQFFQGKLAILRALAEIANLSFDFRLGKGVSIPDDRDDQTARTAHCDTDIVIGVVHDVVPVDRCIDDGKFFECGYHCFHKK